MWDNDCFQVTSDQYVDRVVVVEGKWKDGGLEATMVDVYAPNATADQRVF